MADITNSTSNTVINGTSGADTLRNYYGNNVTILAAAGNDTIYNSYSTGGVSYVTIDGGTGNDSVSNFGNITSINGGAGNDKIYNGGKSVTAGGGAGNDSIENGGTNDVTITGDAGNDTLVSSSYPTTIDGGADNDLISLKSTGNLIRYSDGDGNDTVYGFNGTDSLQISGNYTTQVSGDDVIVKVGNGSLLLKDTKGTAFIINGSLAGDTTASLKFIQLPAGGGELNNTFAKITIVGSTGADEINNYEGDKVSINGGAGSDSIDIWGGSSVTVRGGTGNDDIGDWSKQNNNVIDAGAGNDYIYISSDTSNTTVIGGTGNDKINLYNGTYDLPTNIVIIYKSGDGNDSITGFNDTSTLSISGGSYSTTVQDDNIIVTVGDGKITLVGAKGLSTLNIAGTYSTGSSGNSKHISLTTENDDFTNSENGAAIFALGGNDTVSNTGASVSIDAGAGNDTVYNGGDNVTINGGTGDDSIYNNRWGTSHSINGGSGNDTLYTRSDGKKTLTGGAGSDLFIFNYDSDSLYDTDIITDYAEEDKISIGGVSITTVLTSGNNVVFTAGNNTLKVNNAANKVITYIDGGGEHTYGQISKLVSLTSGNDTYSNSVDGATIQALGGADSISNTGANVSIDAGAGNDTVYNGGDNVTINGGTGDDSIYNNRWGTSHSINGGSGNDTLYTRSDGKKTLTGGAGSDLFIFNYDSDSLYDTDIITDYAEEDKISIGGVSITTVLTSGNNVVFTAGNNTLKVNNAANKVITYIDGGGEHTYGQISKLVSLTSGNDTYSNSVDGATINALGGADSISNTGASVSIDGGTGNDTIFSRGRNVSIDGGTGNDSIQNEHDGIKILGGTGKDTIFNNTGTHITIDGGDDDDVILNYSGVGDISINGGAGNDKISLNSSWGVMTVRGGSGNDTLYGDSIQGYGAAYSVWYQYASGDGNDIIYSFNSVDTLKIGDGTGTYSSQVSGSNVIVTVGDGKITLVGAKNLSTLNILGEEKSTVNPLLVVGTESADNLTNSLAGATINALGDADTIKNTAAQVSINGGAANDSINNSGTKITILGGDGNDKIINTGATVTIDAGAGNDSIKNTAASVSIVGGAGKDSVTNTKTKVTINAGADNDRIVNSAATVSIFAGAGDDLISLGANASNNLITYSAGNDTIIGYTEDDTIRIASGTAVTSTSGDDLILTVGNSSISVKGGKGKTVTYVDKGGTHTYPEPENTDVVIDGKIARLTENFKADSYGIADNLDVTTIDATAVTYDIELAGNKMANSILGGEGNDIIRGAGGNDSLTGGKGIDIFVFNERDGSDVITDYNCDEGDLISISSSEIATAVSSNGTDITFTVGKGINKSYITVTGGRTQETITYFDGNGDEHQIENEIVSFNEGTGTTLLSIYAKDSFDIADYPKYVDTVQTIDASALTHGIAITANKNANTVIGGAGSDTLDGAAGNDYLTGGAGNDVFLYSAGNDTIADYQEGDIIRINGTVSKIAPSKQNVIFTVKSKGKITVKDGAGKVITYEVTEKTRFYPVDISEDGKSATLTADYTKDSFDVADYGDYADILTTIDASAVTHDIAVTANKNANTIIGGTGNDTLYGGKGNDYLVGGEGSDVFVYKNGDGNDTIVGYTQGEDRIQIALKDISSVIASASVKGSNVTFTVGKGKIVVKDGTEQLITFVDANGKEHFYPDEVSFSDNGKQATILADYHKSAFKISDYGSYGTTVQTIDGSSVTHDLSITGNSKANEISGSTNNDFLDGAAGKDILYGGEGNDTLQGGTGNDTLWGEDGADVFLYNAGDGNDIIEDYAKGEKISVTGAAVDKATVSGNNVVLTIGAGKITVRDAKGTPVTYYDDNGKHTYGASNDLLIDDNYSADAAQLGNIVEPFKASYTPYDFDSGLNLTRNEKLSLVFLSAKTKS